MPEITYRVTINAARNKIFQALTEQKHLAAWWTADCTADPTVGTQANFEFKAPNGDQEGYAHMRIEKLLPGKLVEWKCIDHNFQGTTDWIGTTIRFKFSENGLRGTDLDFAHVDWKDKEGCYKKCVDGWRHFLIVSLKNYLEIGKGAPYAMHRAQEVPAG